MSHTPGPWTLHQQGSMRACDGRHDSVHGCRTLAEAETLNIDRAEAEANARLISSAPELLVALKALIAGVERDDNPRDEGHSEHSDEMSAARTVVAKAEGG